MAKDFNRGGTIKMLEQISPQALFQNFTFDNGVKISEKSYKDYIDSCAFYKNGRPNKALASNWKDFV